MRLIFIFLLFAISPTFASYRQFLENCIKKQDDGFCNMECRNFTADLNDFEINDCKYTETTPYYVSITKEMYPLEAMRQLEKEEILLRETLQTQVELDSSTEDYLELMADEYRKNVTNSSEKLQWPLELKFIVFLPICDGCPQGDDVIIERCSKISSILAIQVSHKKNSSSIGFLPILAVLIGVVFIAGVLFVTTRKRRIQHQSAVYYPPMEFTKRTKVFTGLPDQYDVPWGHGVPANEVFAPPPPPALIPPPVHQGHVVIKMEEEDLAANYEDVVLLKNTPLHNFVKNIKNDEFGQDELKNFVERYDINGHDGDGCTAFLLAVRSGNCHLAKELLYLGADGNKMDKSHMTGLHHAVENRDIRMLQMLTKYEEPKYTENDEPEMVKVLVDTIIDGRKAIDALTLTGLTPLMKCAFADIDMAVPLARILIECGANVANIGDLDCQTPKLRTVLHYAAQYSQHELIKYILSNKNGLSVIIYMDFKDQTALCIACENGDLASAKVLLENGALQFLPDNEKEKQPRGVARTQEIVDLLDQFKGKLIKEGTVRRNKRNKVKKPELQKKIRRSSGYFSRSEPDSFTEDQDAEISEPHFSHCHASGEYE